LPEFKQSTECSAISTVQLHCTYVLIATVIFILVPEEYPHGIIVVVGEGGVEIIVVAAPIVVAVPVVVIDDEDVASNNGD
jgi:hypothetical protein